jgi:hypothetical protein
MHMISSDRLVPQCHGVESFGSSGPCLNKASYYGWLSWVNFELVIGFGSSLLTPLVLSVGVRQRLMLICSSLVTGRVACGQR